MVEIQREYVPGACNISKEEEARRLASGWFGLIVTLALEAAFVVWNVAPLWRLTLFFPAALAAAGFLQVAFHFCAGFGLAGVFNVGNAVGVTQTVADPQALARDRAKALLIFGLAVVDGAIAAVLAYLIV